MLTPVLCLSQMHSYGDWSVQRSTGVSCSFLVAHVATCENGTIAVLVVSVSWRICKHNVSFTHMMYGCRSVSLCHTLVISKVCTLALYWLHAQSTRCACDMQVHVGCPHKLHFDFLISSFLLARLQAWNMQQAHNYYLNSTNELPEQWEGFGEVFKKKRRRTMPVFIYLLTLTIWHLQHARQNNMHEHFCPTGSQSDLQLWYFVAVTCVRISHVHPKGSCN